MRWRGCVGDVCVEHRLVVGVGRRKKKVISPHYVWESVCMWASGHLWLVFGSYVDSHVCFCSLQSSMESPNLEFEYGDTDTLTAELSGKTDRRRTTFGKSPKSCRSTLKLPPELISAGQSITGPIRVLWREKRQLLRVGLTDECKKLPVGSVLPFLTGSTGNKHFLWAVSQVDVWNMSHGFVKHHFWIFH